MLKIENLQKSFGAGTPDCRLALNRVSLTLSPGDFAVVLGGNGSGKTTLLNCIAGVHAPDSGRILIDGSDVTRLPEHRRAPLLGRVFQDPMIGTAAGMTVEENLALAMGRGQRRGLSKCVTRGLRQDFRQAVSALGLGLENRMTAKAGQLSGGQRQALTLLMATLRQPRLLLLDEHTAALDPKTAAAVMEITAKIVASGNGPATLMVTHDIGDAIKYGNRLIMMRDGEIVFQARGGAKSGLTPETVYGLFSGRRLAGG